MRGAPELDIVLEVGTVTRIALEPAMRQGVDGKGWGKRITVGMKGK